MPNEHASHATGSEFELFREQRPAGLVSRFFITFGQLLGLLLGGINVYLTDQKARGQANRLPLLFLRFWLFLLRPFLDKKIIYKPFPVQFRLRLEQLGPTYIKLGQILSLREDLLPSSITNELKNLLDRLPAVPIERFQELVLADLKRPLDTLFRWIDPKPLGSASLAQTHRARLVSGERVALKVLKPGVRRTVETDTRLLGLFGRFLQIFLARYQPKRLIDEFCRYTLHEVDLRFEADNAEAFAANFKSQPEIHFPKIYREYSNRDVLCMEYFRGIKPDARAAAVLTPQEKNKVVQLGIGAIIQMIFRDGFFHADLHPGNLIIFKDASVGFIDLGMVGRFEHETKRRLFYYFYSLVMNEPENAARYLASLSLPVQNSDVEGFQRAVSGLYARFLRSPSFKDFSLAQVILQSILLAGQYRIEYPSEIILMVKALVTVEGVGNVIVPGIDIVQASRQHVRRLLIDEFNPAKILRSNLLVVPEIIDILNRSPLVLTEGLALVEKNLKKPTNDKPLVGVERAIVVAAALVAVAILYGVNAPWYILAGVGVVALVALLRK
ncbi:MAG: AarF/ABC1/UbiB kinase family protein [Anaerolineae bacterium]|nr:AarF/ABC1/UbiB kinase family protein [Anaerolineae bacterium]